MESPSPLWPYRPQIGCFLLFGALLLMCLMPLFLLEAAQLALRKLHLSPPAAMLVLIGIFLGGLINLPVSVTLGGREGHSCKDYRTP